MNASSQTVEAPELLELAARIAAAVVAHQPLPAITVELDLDAAYELQHQVTRLVNGDEVGGIKAGVTAQAVQHYFGLEHALLGNLYAHGALVAGTTLERIPGRSLECEIAVRVDAGGNPIAMAPAIEVVRVDFSRAEDMSAANLIACNLGADARIVGDFIPWNPTITDLPMRLFRDAQLVNETDATQAIGGPASAMEWIREEALARGFSFSDGMIVMTGACGQVVPADCGSWRAEFGGLESLAFTVS